MIYSNHKNHTFVFTNKIQIVKKLLFLVSLILIFSSATKTKEVVVTIVQLGHVNRIAIDAVARSITSFYGYKCVIGNEVQFTPDELSKSKTRYSADKIVDKFSKKAYTLVITEKDICTPMHNYPEWGIFGLGSCPGSSCVVSTFRLKRNASEAKMTERLIKVCLHELGHNLGLEHCDKDPECLMSAAKGTIKQVDQEKLYFCQNCKSRLNRK